MANSNEQKSTRTSFVLVAALLTALPLTVTACTAVASQERAHTLTCSTSYESTGIPVIGHRFKVDFGAPYIFALDFKSETEMSFTQIAASGVPIEDALAGAVQITRVEIRPNVYMVYWSEPFNNDTTVTHVQDFEKGWVWTNISTPGQPFVNLNGPLTPLDAE